MSIKAELNYIEFHNTKGTLETGYYRVIEADGDISIAKVTSSPWRGPSSVEWLSEDEYLEMLRTDQELYGYRDYDEFNRITPEDLAEAEFDQGVYGIEPGDMTDEQYAEHCEIIAQNHRDGVEL